MAQNPIRTAAAAESGLVTGALLEAIVKRFGFVLNVGETLGGFDFDVGEPPLLVHYAVTGFDYYLDTTDTTTADDGTTCLVSGNGLRYHIEDAASLSLNSILSFEATPPGSPVVGDAHVVDTGGTGAFAGHDDDIALYTRRGWIFATPEIGLTVYNEDTSTNWQFNGTAWTGFAVELADLSVRPEALLKSLGIAVESTLNTPPGSPAANTYWLVGTAPTGAFVGHAGDVAYYKSAAWNFIDCYEGATVFHKTFGFELFYVSGSWLGGAGSDLQEFSTAGGATWTKPAKGNIAFVQCWGAGGSGGRAGTGDGGGGGGGGAYFEGWFKLSALGATEAVTVGAGGAARTSDETDGAAGGNSSFGSWLTAYGGGGGAGAVTAGGGGGGGGGRGGAGASVAGAGASTAGGAGGVDLLGAAGGTAGTAGSGGVAGGAGGSSTYGGGGGGGGSDGTGSGNGGDGGAALYGGGGGGGGVPSTDGGNGGKSGYGGGGGGGGDGGGAIGAKSLGGASSFGGNGGNGATGSNNAAAGSQPGGGGGGSVTGNSGKGGDGRVRVTVW